MNTFGGSGHSNGSFESQTAYYTPSPFLQPPNPCYFEEARFSSVAGSYRCEDCRINFDRVENFLEHVRSHKEEEEEEEESGHGPGEKIRLECDVCGKSFRTERALNVHSEYAHNPCGFTCPRCTSVFQIKSEFAKHLRQDPGCRLPQENAINSLINSQLSCKHCGKLFISLTALKNHSGSLKCPANLPRNKANLVYDPSLVIKPGDYVTVFCCPVSTCSKIGCITLRAYKMHVKCVHKQPNLKPCVKNLEAKFICTVRGCGKLFVEESQLDIHLKHHETYTPRRGKYVCDICHEDFYQTQMLKKHLLASHPDRDEKSINERNVEPEDSQQDRELIYDESIVLAPGTLIDVFKCPICGKDSFTDIKSFKLHAKHIHPEGSVCPIETKVQAQFICQVQGCGKMYVERRQFEIHGRHHKTYVKSKGRYFKCELCEMQFNTKSNLDVHVIQAHGPSSENTEEKKDVIYDNVHLVPGTMMDVFHCPIQGCDKRNYIDSKSVKTHCKKVHFIDGLELDPVQAEARYICQVRGCQKLFMEHTQIMAHYKHHRTYVPTNGSFTCSLCSEVFTRQELLNSHTLEKHISRRDDYGQGSSSAGPYRSFGSKVRGYKCNFCQRKFLVQSAYSKHVTDAHSMQGVPPIEVRIKPKFSCEEPNCGRHFLTHQKYKHHLQSHALHKEVMKCPKCDKEFSMFKSLHSHMLQNHSDTTLEDMRNLEAKHAKCPTCGNMFRDETVLKQHMKIKGHGDAAGNSFFPAAAYASAVLSLNKINE